MRNWLLILLGTAIIVADTVFFQVELSTAVGAFCIGAGIGLYEKEKKHEENKHQ